MTTQIATQATAIDTTAKKATGMPASLLVSAGSVISAASPQLASTAATGTRFLLTLLQICQPGTARSRENAKKVREQLVTHAMPQKNWPIVDIRITVSAQPELIALVKIGIDPPDAASTSTAANVIANRTNQPITAEKNTDCQTPLAAEISA